MDLVDLLFGEEVVWRDVGEGLGIGSVLVFGGATFSPFAATGGLVFGHVRFLFLLQRILERIGFCLLTGLRP